MVRLKLHLTFLWFAASPPHDLTYPARAWAVLLGLDDPERNGARRVRQAITALAAANLVEVVTRQGQPSTVTLLDEGGQGGRYTLPGAAYSKFRDSPDEWRHRYVQLPDALWTSGWLSVLSGPALAMLLVLYVERGARKGAVDVWFSPGRARRLYGLSDETRSKGLRELRAAKLVTARRKTVSRDALDFKRVRNTYRLIDDQLREPAAIPKLIAPAPPETPASASASDLFAEMPRVTDP